eukprot:m.95147 g.95147  ORF g.95147 m.95147 type:complete len:475 (-) comp18413_c0_seq1:65-1489(-)
MSRLTLEVDSLRGVPLGGSDSNSVNSSAYRKPAKKQSNFVSSMGNFSVQYNFACASIVLSVMKTDDDHVTKNHPELHADYPPPDWVHYTLLGLVFAGAVCGMCLLGYLGDFLGRHRAMLVTLGLTVFGALGSAVLSWGSPQTIYAVIGACRFILGMGVGGIYPLSAAKSAESSAEGENMAKRVGWAFFWQTPGAMFPYLVCMLLHFMNSTSWVTSFQFRFLLGLGAVPAAIVFYAEYSADHVPEDKMEKKESPLAIAWRHPEYFRKLIGTGGSWFLYDVSYYGTAIFTPAILANIFGDSDSLFDLCWQSVVVSTMGIPACIIGVLLLQPKGARWLNIYGFYFIAVMFGALALAYNLTKDDEQKALKFVLFGLVTFALNFGPNIATYVLPAEIFPTEVRSSFHGLSAASGKLGAVVGTFMYSPIADKYGFAAVMWVQAGLAVLGALATVFFVDVNDGKKALSRDDERTALLGSMS